MNRAQLRNTQFSPGQAGRLDAACDRFEQGWLAGASPRLADLLLDEAEAVARLQHPHIVQIHEVGQHDRHAYMALEYVDGGSLARQLVGTPLPAHQAAQWLETLAQTMHYAHQRGIVHRDLTPGNILL